MSYIGQVLVGMIVMGLLDIPMITYVISPTLKRFAPELVAKRPDIIAALVFYVGYVSLVVFLSQKLGHDLRSVVGYGALLGLLAYGTYEFTNKAVIKGWPWQMVAVDTIWGVVLTAIVAGAAYYVFNR